MTIRALAGTYGANLDARGRAIGESSLGLPHNIFNPNSAYSRELANLTAEHISSVINGAVHPISVGLNLWRVRNHHIGNFADTGNFTELAGEHFRVQRQAAQTVLGDTYDFDQRNEVKFHLSCGPLAIDSHEPSTAPSHDDERGLAFNQERLRAGGLLGVDVVFETVAALSEARNVAYAAQQVGHERGTKLPHYYICFVLGADGCLLDGTDLGTAITSIDHIADSYELRPAGYGANCCSLDTIEAAKTSTRPEIIARCGLWFPNGAGHEIDDHFEREKAARSGHLLRGGINNEAHAYLHWLARNSGELSRNRSIGYCCGTEPRDNGAIAQTINSGHMHHEYRAARIRARSTPVE